MSATTANKIMPTSKKELTVREDLRRAEISTLTLWMQLGKMVNPPEGCQVDPGYLAYALDIFTCREGELEVDGDMDYNIPALRKTVCDKGSTRDQSFQALEDMCNAVHQHLTYATVANPGAEFEQHSLPDICQQTIEALENIAWQMGLWIDWQDAPKPVNYWKDRK